MNNIGEFGEKFAANYLIAQGYTILEANHFNKKGYRLGEIDLVAKDRKGWYVFVEVKTRKGKKNQIVPEASINPSKIRKIVKTAHEYLGKHDVLEENWRIDAVAVVLDFEKRKAHLKHIKYIRT